MNSKSKGIIAYLFGWIGGLIVLFGFKDNDRKSVFHACQAITISVASIVFNIAFGIVNGIMSSMVGFSLGFVTSIVSLLVFALNILGIVKAVKDEPDPKLPVVGDLTERLFENKINSAPEAVGATVARFDPNTGQPINSQPQANFDPNTGQPINSQPQANFDPNTGQPVNSQPQANFDPNTGQPVSSSQSQDGQNN